MDLEKDNLLLLFSVKKSLQYLFASRVFYGMSNSHARVALLAIIWMYKYFYILRRYNNTFCRQCIRCQQRSGRKYCILRHRKSRDINLFNLCADNKKTERRAVKAVQSIAYDNCSDCV